MLPAVGKHFVYAHHHPCDIDAQREAGATLSILVIPHRLGLRIRLLNFRYARGVLLGHRTLDQLSRGPRVICAICPFSKAPKQIQGMDVQLAPRLKLD